LTARLQAPAPVLANTAPAGGWLEPRPVEHAPSLFARPGFPSFTKQPVPPPINSRPQAQPLAEPIPEPIVADTNMPPPPEPLPIAPPEARPELPPAEVKAIQVHNTYLVLETPEGVLVIDQHALHERILFEQIQQRVRNHNLESQQLLIPEPVELTAEQAACTLERRGVARDQDGAAAEVLDAQTEL